MARTIKKKKFSLGDYKKEKNLNNTKFKEQEYLPIDEAFHDVLSIKGIPLGHITLLMGHSDTSKTTAMVKAARSAQNAGKLPVFIITEMKWDWGHAKMLGLEIEEVVDEKTGELQSIEGDFLYTDRAQQKTIEDVAMFINKTIDDQESGKLPIDLVFLWDSVGSLPCQMSVDKQKNNNEWAAGAMSVQFGASINQRIVASRKEECEFTNTLICVNKVWTQKAASPMAQPKMKPKGGMTMYFDCTYAIKYGNEADSGVNILKATKNKKKVTWGTRVSLELKKNHINGISTSGKVIVTPTGYIADSESAINKFKANNLEYFSKILGEDLKSVDDFVLTNENEISTKGSSKKAEDPIKTTNGDEYM